METENFDAKDVGERLRAFREHLSMSQEALGRAIGGTKRGVQDNELGKSSPQSRYLGRLAEMGLNINWLLTGDGRMLMKEMEAGAQAPVSPLDVEILELVLDRLEEKIASSGKRVSAKKKAELVALLYEYIIDTGKAEGPSVERFLRLVA